jgi:plastocyanin
MTTGMTSRFALLATVLVAACGGSKEPATPGAAAGTAAAPTVAATGKVITIMMITDEKSSRFEPNQLEVHRGDVLRYTIGVGVHSVHFLPDSNPGIPNLPPVSDLLQLPGQTLDITVDFPVGKTIYFQCDPHAALGMRGHLKVVG